MNPPFLVFIASSLDGFIARRNSDIEWLSQSTAAPNEDHGYETFVSRIDTIVMGRGTFEKVSSFASWPYDKLRVIVLSQTMEKLPVAFQGKAELHRGSIEELLSTLAQSKGVYVDGGRVIQSFLKLGLIDEMTVTQIPVLLGGGIPLFSDLNLNRDQWWTLTASRAFSISGFVQNTYLRRLTKDINKE